MVTAFVTEQEMRPNESKKISIHLIVNLFNYSVDFPTDGVTLRHYPFSTHAKINEVCMKDIALHNIPFDGETHRPRMYSPHLLPLLQSLLATLADIDFEYESEIEKVSRNATDVNLKIKVIEKLKAKHRERREPYIRQLASLQERIMPATSS